MTHNFKNELIFFWIKCATFYFEIFGFSFISVFKMYSTTIFNEVYSGYIVEL